MSVVLGIDPGSRFVGVGILKQEKNKTQCLHYELVSVEQNLTFAEKLFKIQSRLRPIFEKFRPEVTVVEKAFLGKNVDSAFKLGHVRGVCLGLAVEFQSQVVEFAPKTVKKKITGNGGASKEEVRLVLSQLFQLPRDLSLDVSDGLSLSYCYIQEAEVQQKLKRHLRD